MSESTVAPATTEASAAPPTETKPAEIQKADSGKLLDLAKREAEFAKKEVARKEEFAKYQSEYQKTAEELKAYKSIRETYKDNPVAALQRLGLTYDELTEAVIAYHDKKEQPQSVDINKVREEVEQQIKAKELQRLESERSAALENFNSEISKFVETNAEKFPFVTTLYKSIGETETPQELIYGIIEAHFNETNEILDFHVAAAAAEEHFREEWEKLNGKLTPKAKAELKEEAKEVAKEVSREPLKETTTSAPAGQKGEPISAKAFSVKVRDTPTTITNKMFRPKTVKEYDPKSEQRKDAITRGLEAYEAAARNRK